MAIELPKKTVRMLVEHKGAYEDVEVEDRPTKVLKNQFNELKGIYEDVEVELTDEEIYQARAGKPVAKKKNAKKPVTKKRKR